MIKFIALCFLLLALYGCTHYVTGGAILSLIIAGFAMWADQIYKARERRWESMPRNAKVAEKPTQEILRDEGSESS